MHLIATLVIAIGPDTVVLVVLDIARNLRELIRHTHLRILRVEGNGRGVGRAGRPKTVLESTKAVLSTGPLGKGKLTGLLEVGCYRDVAAVNLLVEPLAVVTTCFDLTMNVLDVDCIGGVDREAGLAFLVFAQLELAEALRDAVGGGVVFVVAVAAEEVAVGGKEGVAFA